MSSTAKTADFDLAACEAQAYVHHQYLLGLELMVAVEEGREVIGEWMFRLFRRQHEEKFLSSFSKLGLEGLPDAVACAQYHVLSNSIGGVGVEFMPETDRKAWVRFRYPRWMYDGAVACGIPVEASRGFLKGWYAQNGVSLGNPRLGFVCVSEDMTGQFGFCGYFQEYDYDLSEDERLRFAPDERPPAFDPAAQPAPPTAAWDAERLARANRNYAVEYIRNGTVELAGVIGTDRTRELTARAARLTGLQCFPAVAAMMGVEEGGLNETAELLSRLFSSMGDICNVSHEVNSATLVQSSLRITRGIDAPDRTLLRDGWIELWRGLVNSQRQFMRVAVEPDAEGLIWRISAE